MKNNNIVESAVHPQMQRLTNWIERLEQQALELIEQANIDELTAKERIDLGLKMISHVHRFVVASEHLHSVDSNEESKSITLNVLMSQLRGETVEVGEEEDTWYAHSRPR